VKCASCASKGIPCVNSSWASLDKTREEAKSQIDADLLELERITARLRKNRKILKLAEDRAKAKAVCLLDELEEEEEMQRVKGGGLSNAELEELSRDLVVQNNILSNSPPIWSAWDPESFDRSLKRRRLDCSSPRDPSSDSTSIPVVERGPDVPYENAVVQADNSDSCKVPKYFLLKDNLST
jgi:hypothetical protein